MTRAWENAQENPATGGSNLWLRSKPCLVSGRGTNPQPIRRCGAGGDLQSAKLNLTPTYWGLLKQPDQHEPTREDRSCQALFGQRRKHLSLADGQMYPRRYGDFPDADLSGPIHFVCTLCCLPYNFPHV